MSEAALAPRPVPRPRTPVRPPPRLAAGGANIVLRVAEATMEVSGSRTMDRLVRSRAWVVIVAFGLIGIVAMQVSMLKLNNGIGNAVETAATLERGNATLRGQVSRLSSGDRVQSLAGPRGFVMPEPADVTYARAGTLTADGARAAEKMRAPDPEIAGPAGSMTAAASVTAITGADPNAAPPDPAAVGADPAAGTSGTPGTPGTPGAPATETPTAPPVTPAPAAAAPAQTPASTGAAATPAPAAPTTTSSGGVTSP
jgi:hypothetical protein